MWRRRGPRLPFIPHRFLAGLALSDLALFLAGLWNAADDGSIFQHCFTCSKWNHMPYGTASLLSVIGSTCTAKPRVKRSRRHYRARTLPPSLPHSPLHLPSPSPRSGVPHFSPGPSGRSHCKELTWLCMSNSVQWDDYIACPTILIFFCAEI